MAQDAPTQQPEPHMEGVIAEMRQGHRAICAMLHLLHGFKSHANYLLGALDELTPEDWQRFKTTHAEVLLTVRQLADRLERITSPGEARLRWHDTDHCFRASWLEHYFEVERIGSSGEEHIAEHRDGGHTVWSGTYPSAHEAMQACERRLKGALQ